MDNPQRLINASSVSRNAGGNDGKFGFEHGRIGPQIGLTKLGCSVYVVPPGKRAFPYHAHSAIEEMFVVLEGRGTLRHEGKELRIEAGDVIAAPCGEAHQIINDSDRELRYLAVSTNEATDVVHYPDSGKVLAFAANLGDGLMHVSRLSDAVDYYEGEG